MISKIINHMTCDVATSSNSWMMFDDVIFLINVSTISQLKSLSMPKNSKGALSIES
jgi:hypothetical protein